MNSQSKSSQESKRDYWHQQIKTWRRSGLSQKRYCRSRALALSTFCYWKRRLRNQEPPTPTFYPLAIPASLQEPTEEGLMLLVGSKQFQVQIKKDFSPAPIFDDLFKWLSKKSLQVVPKSLLGKAVNYTLNQWNRLVVYLEHPMMTPDNNLAGNAIRPFVIGRKNWLFSGTPDGAKASADIYSLIEIAKANNLEPYKYLRFLFEKLPLAESENVLRDLLPMNLKPKQLVLPDIPTGV